VGYLLSSGAIANYKNLKQNKSAKSWSKLSHHPHSTRLIELAEVVQHQSKLIFNSITTGEMDVIKKILKAGEPFDVNGEAKHYKQMEKFAKILDTTTSNLVILNRKMSVLIDKKEKSEKVLNDSIEKIKNLESELSEIIKKKDKLQLGLTKDFIAYDKITEKLTIIDLEEIKRLLTPNLALKISVFLYAITFEVLNFNDFKQYKNLTEICNDEKNVKQWWNRAVKSLLDAKLVLIKLRAFNIDKLTQRYDLKNVITEAKHFYAELLKSLEKEISILHLNNIKHNYNDKQSTNDLLHNGNSYNNNMSDINNNNDNNPQNNKKKKNKKINNTDVTIDTNKTEFINEEKNKKLESLLDDWMDSDHEDEDDIKNRGSFVKGVWTPLPLEKIKKIKKDKTNTDSNNSNNNNNINTSDNEKSDYEKNSEKVKNLKFLRITEEVVQQYADTKNKYNKNNIMNIVNNSLNFEVVKTIEIVEKKNANPILSSISHLLENRRHSKDVRSHSNNNSEVAKNEIEAYTFIETILTLMKAIAKFALDNKELSELKQETTKRNIVLTELKFKNTEYYETHQLNTANHLEMEALWIKSMKIERDMTRKVFLYREKVRVCRLLNQVSVNGHTLISWASSLGCYEVVEYMIAHGATVGYPAAMLHEIGTYLQISYKIACLAAIIKKRKKEENFVLVENDDSTHVNNNGDTNNNNNNNNNDDKNIEEKTKTDEINNNNLNNNTIEEKKPKTILELIKDLEILKRTSKKLHSNIEFSKRRIRLPVPEAAYCGKWEILQLFQKKRVLHRYFIDSYAYPSPPPPFLKKLEYSYDFKKKSLADIVAFAMNDLAAGFFYNYCISFIFVLFLNFLWYALILF
jgi:hypothetical protein